MKRFTYLLVLVAVGTLAITHHRTAAQEEAAEAPEEASSSTTPPHTAPGTSASAAESTLQELKDRRAANPLIEPAVTSAAPGATLETSELDPRIIGHAPGIKPSPLRREGQFLIDRRGRLVRSPRTGHMMFQFDADQQQSPEMPMVLLPCRLLENMEDLVAERGDRIAFQITGQVFVYRQANYVLPTLFTVAIDKGNLQQ